MYNAAQYRTEELPKHKLFASPAMAWPQDKWLSGATWHEGGPGILLPGGLVFPGLLVNATCEYEGCATSTTRRAIFTMYDGGPIFCVRPACPTHQPIIQPKEGSMWEFLEAIPPEEADEHLRQREEWLQARQATRQEAKVRAAPPVQPPRRPVEDDIRDLLDESA